MMNDGASVQRLDIAYDHDIARFGFGCSPWDVDMEEERQLHAERFKLNVQQKPLIPSVTDAFGNPTRGRKTA